MSRGRLIAIEGGDGSGKATQAELTRQYIEETLGRPVMKASFPRYGEESSLFVQKYLNGEYGDIDAMPPEVVALLFATDRMAGTPEISSWLNAKPDGVAVLDRYVGSNLAHQGAKIQNTAKRHAFYSDIQSYETNVLGMLTPDVNIVLLLPSDIAQQNVDTKDPRSYTNKKRDIHEANKQYLEQVKFCYEELCKLFPDKYIPVNCTNKSGDMRTREEIQQDIRSIIAI